MVDILIANHSDLKAVDLLDRTPEGLALTSKNLNVCHAVSKALSSTIPVKMMIRLTKEQQARQAEETKQKVAESMGAIASINFANLGGQFPSPI